jgi:hypothetical protein
MTTQNNETKVEADGRRRLVLIAAAVALLLVAAGIIVGVIALERGSRVPAYASAPAAVRSPASGPGALVS